MSKARIGAKYRHRTNGTECTVQNVDTEGRVYVHFDNDKRQVYAPSCFASGWELIPEKGTGGDELVRSVYDNQDELIDALIRLHVPAGEFDCDVSFGKGAFYKSGRIPLPRYRFDVNPQSELATVGDARNLPFPSNHIDSIMFDPPVLGESGRGSIIKGRFSAYKRIPDLWVMYREAMEEFYRVLKPGGVLAFKCQDSVESAKNYISHVEVMNQAYRIGFYPTDLFILVAKHRMSQWNLKRQRHARKYHSYFWVFTKAKSKVEYPSLEGA